jgi:mono/diheme cytochrome c family protein
VRRLILALATLATVAPAAAPAARADEGDKNPRLGDPQAIDEGRRFYRTRCVICHGSQGGRGPNLFATGISDWKFLETVINGRKGTLMPAFGDRMSPDDVWAVNAYVKSTDHYE